MNTILDYRVNVTIEQVDAVTGRLLARERVHNLVTLAGRNLARDLLVGDATATLTHFALGTGTTSVVAGDTALETEVYRDVITQTSTSDGEVEVKQYLSSTEANGSSLSEAGLLTASTGGVLFARVTYTPIAKTSSIAVSFTWTVTIGASDGVHAKSWTTGDTITATLLNAIETGIDDAHAGSIDAGAIDTTELADGAVTTAKLAAGSVTDSELNASAAIDASKIADGSVSNTEFQYLGNVTSDIQTQLDGKASAAGAIPSGIVAMWSGLIVNIPSGWVLCDGTNGTPDLRDRFLVGAGGAYSVNDTGGADSVTLSTSQMPAHTHGDGSLSTNSAGNHSHSGSTNTTGSHTHSYDDFSVGGILGAEEATSGRNVGIIVTSRSTSSAGSHSHTLSISNAGNHSHSVSGNTASTGGGSSHENRPPYYALAFIMKS